MAPVVVLKGGMRGADLWWMTGRASHVVACLAVHVLCALLVQIGSASPASGWLAQWMGRCGRRGGGRQNYPNQCERCRRVTAECATQGRVSHARSKSRGTAFTRQLLVRHVSHTGSVLSGGFDWAEDLCTIGGGPRGLHASGCRLVGALTVGAALRLSVGLASRGVSGEIANMHVHRTYAPRCKRGTLCTLEDMRMHLDSTLPFIDVVDVSGGYLSIRQWGSVRPGPKFYQPDPRPKVCAQRSDCVDVPFSRRRFWPGGGSRRSKLDPPDRAGESRRRKIGTSSSSKP